MARDQMAVIGDALSNLIDARVKLAIAEAMEAHRCTNEGERLLSITAACERASVGRTTLYRWIADGLPTVSAPGRADGTEIRRVRASDLDDWMFALPTQRAATTGGTVGAAHPEPNNLRQMVANRLARQGRPLPRRSTKPANKKRAASSA